MSYTALRSSPDDKTMMIVVYILYLLGFVTAGATTLVGLAMAYVLKRNASEMTYSHCIFLIHTFWGTLFVINISLVMLVLVTLGFTLLISLIGPPFGWLNFTILWLTAIWFAVRCIVGLIAAVNDQPYGRPRAWIL